MGTIARDGPVADVAASIFLIPDTAVTDKTDERRLVKQHRNESRVVRDHFAQLEPRRSYHGQC